MKKIMLLAGVIELVIMAGMLLSGRASSVPQNSQVAAHQLTSAPYRDGLYLGKLTAERGAESHISSGRWTTEGDRASFTAGFQQGYQGGRVLRASTAGAK